MDYGTEFVEREVKKRLLKKYSSKVVNVSSAGGFVTGGTGNDFEKFRNFSQAIGYGMPNEKELKLRTEKCLERAGAPFGRLSSAEEVYLSLTGSQLKSTGIANEESTINTMMQNFSPEQIGKVLEKYSVTGISRLEGIKLCKEMRRRKDMQRHKARINEQPNKVFDIGEKESKQRRQEQKLGGKHRDEANEYDR